MWRIIKPVLLSLVVGLACFSVGYTQPQLSKPVFTPTLLSNTFPEKTVEGLISHPYDSGSLFARSGEVVYQSEDFGKTWARLFQLEGIEGQINFIESTEAAREVLFVGTTEGLYQVDYHRKGNISLARVFTSFDKKENHIHAMAINPFSPESIFLGTKKGLLISKDGGGSWNKSPLISPRQEVLALAFHPNIPGLLFVQTNVGLSKINVTEREVRKVFSNYEVDLTENEDAAVEDFYQRRIVFSLNDDNLIYFAESNGLYFSKDLGETWQPLSVARLERAPIDFQLVSSDDSLVFINPEGIWRFQKEETPFLQKLVPSQIFPFDHLTLMQDQLIYNAGNQLYAIDFSGIQTFRLGESEVFSGGDFLVISPDIPSIRDVQIAALQYALLSTKRMKSWQRRSRFRGFIPSVSFDFSRSLSNNIDVDRGSTSTPDMFLNGPDDEDWDFGFDVEWDLADIVWNDTETSIEIRARALVDQREEVLNEVTRLYFEWKRLQAELGYRSQIPAEEKLQKTIRSEEILAQIDGLTGGYLTEHQKG